MGIALQLEQEIWYFLLPMATSVKSQRRTLPIKGKLRTTKVARVGRLRNGELSRAALTKSSCVPSNNPPNFASKTPCRRVVLSRVWPEDPERSGQL